MLNELYQLAKLSMKSLLSGQTLKRTPEPDSVTVGPDAVSQFTNVDTGSYSVLYGLLLEFIYKVHSSSSEDGPRRALDLGSGPGTCASLVVKYLKYERVIGVDLSGPMIAAAQRKISHLQLTQQIGFTKGDITNLTEFANDSFDLVYSLNVLHHLPTQEFLERALGEADRVCKPDGLVFISDVQRPKSKAIADAYLEWFGAELKKNGLLAHYEDFFHSVFAAWSDTEFISVIPSSEKRHWYHVQTRGFSPQQFIVGIPLSQNQLFLREGISDELEKTLIPAGYKDLWKITSRAFQFSRVRALNIKR